MKLLETILAGVFTLLAIGCSLVLVYAVIMQAKTDFKRKPK